MLTIFSCPKAFCGHFNIIQRNAIRSWTLLDPRPEIILIGDDEGIAEICNEFGLRHIPEVERNEYGTPKVNSIFKVGQSEAKNSLVCYVNADIILLTGFLQAITNVDQYYKGQQYLLCGRRWTVKLKDLLDFNLPDWELRLKDYTLSYGEIDSHHSTDYFVFPNGTFTDIPPFAVGRYRHDKWFLYKSRKLGIPVIDASAEILAIHQCHDYSHALSGKDKLIANSPEVEENIRLGKGVESYTQLDATHILNKYGLHKPPFERRLRRYRLRVYYFLYPLKPLFDLAAKGLKVLKKR